jgi:hypothetical protein
VPDLTLTSVRDPVLFRARVLPSGHAARPLQRAGWLTPYAAETLALDARRMARGGRLEVTVAATTSHTTVRQLGQSLARLVGRRIAVEMRRDGVPEIPFRINAAESMDDPAGARRMEA